MNELRFAIIGAGFWARYQLAAWGELPGARCVALCDRVRSKAEALAKDFRIPAVYDRAEDMIAMEKPDFLDVITSPETHGQLVRLAAHWRIPVICQKPMAPDFQEAQALVAICAESKTPLSVHENWRWQRPIRELKSVLESGAIGEAFRARIDYCNSFPVFDNQPFLKKLKRFILSDMGSHILDVARFLFGEATSLYCHTHRVRRDIAGEDAATVLMRMQSGATVTVNLSYSSRIEQDRFPETFIHVEGDQGAVELAPAFWLRVTTESGTDVRCCPPICFEWADPRYALVHASMVDCHRNLLNALRTRTSPETSGADNLKTLKLVEAAYTSAETGQVITLL